MDFPVPDSGLPGSLAARYTGVVELGRGAFGRVIKAQDPELGRAVALKLLNPFRSMDPGARARFEREAQLCSRLASPFFPRVYDFGVADETPYIVFELLPGRSLGSHLREHPGGLPEAEVLPILERILEGLAVLHDHGILHRDVKPDNVLLLETGGIALIDLGLGVAPDCETLTRTGNLVGTPHYLSPDVLRGGAWSAGNDLYAVALIGLQALCGKVPMVGPNLAASLGLRDEGPAAWLSREGVVLRPTWAKPLVAALDPDPGLRPASAHALLADLRTAAGVATTARLAPVVDAPAPAERSHRVRRKRPGKEWPRLAQAAAGAVVGMALTGLAAWFLGTRGPQAPPLPWVGSEALASARAEIEEDPEVRAALAIEGVSAVPDLLETWHRGRAALRRLVARHGLRELLAELAPGAFDPVVADQLGRLYRIQLLLEGPASPVFDADEDPGLGTRLATQVQAIEVPGLDLPLDLGPTREGEEYPARLERADRGYAPWLRRRGGVWEDLYDGLAPVDPLRPALGSRSRLRVVNGLGRMHQWIFGKETEIFTLGISKHSRERFELSPGEIELPLEGVAGDLALALHTEGLGRERPGWLELAGRDADLGVPLVPVPPGTGAPVRKSDTHRLVLVRLRSPILPAGIRGAVLTALGLQPVGKPDPTVMVARVWVHRGGPLPEELGP